MDNGKGAKLLIVEDDDDIRHALIDARDGRLRSDPPYPQSGKVRGLAGHRDYRKSHAGRP
jgi:hypothetical protein